MLGTQFFFGCRLPAAGGPVLLWTAGCWELGAHFLFWGGRVPGCWGPLKDFPIDPLCGAALALDIVGCGLSHLLLLGKCFV